MGKFQFDLLDDREVNAILESTFNILENVGVDIFNEEALLILEKAGATVSENRVKIPASLVKSSVEKAPSKIDIFDQNGQPAMELYNRNSYFGPGVTCPFFFDAYTLERRIARKQDVEYVAKVADYLQNIDFVMSLCNIGDQTPQLADVHEVETILKNTNKPVLTWAFDVDNLNDIIEMAESVVGGREKLREKPFMMIYTEPITPLIHPKESLDKLIYLAKKGLPVVYSPAMTLGGTAPVTGAGALSIGLADALTGVVIAQLINPGTPIICGANGGVLDMVSMQSPYGSPEMSLNDAGAAQIFRSLGIPSFGLAGATDSKVIDAQAAMETTAQMLMYAGCGANLIHDSGMMDLGMTGSVHMLCVCDEIIAFTKRLTRGFAVDENGLAYEEIEKAGPGGMFITEPHTFRNFRKELYMPELALRKKYEVWEEEGKKTMAELAMEKAIHIIENHNPEPLPEETEHTLQEIVKRSEDRIKQKTGC